MKFKFLSILAAVGLTNIAFGMGQDQNGLRRIRSLDDIHGHMSRLNQQDVLEYVRQQAGDAEAKQVSRILKGKAKVAPKKRKKKAQTQLKAFKQAEKDLQQQRKKNGIGAGELFDNLSSIAGNPLGDKISDVFISSISKNGDLYRDKERIFAETEARALERQQNKDIDLEQARIKAKEDRKGYVQAQIRTAGATSQKWINFFKRHPYVIVGIAGGVAASYFAAKHGMKVVFNEIQRIIGIPKLAQDTSLLTFRERVAKSLGLSKEEELKTEDVIFNSEFKNRIHTLTTSIANTVQNDGYFRNLLFYGVPGTGKTLTAKTIAKNSGLDYIYFAASGLAKLTEKDALNQVSDLFEYAKNSPKKLMIIIDEAEVLFADRGCAELNGQMKKILNLILTYTGTESRDYFIIALTNRPQDLDGAVLSRFSETIEFPVPNEQEIRKLLELYVKKLLLTPIIVRPNLYQRLLGQKVQPKRISIEPSALNRPALAAIAKKIHSFVGRDISQLIISMQSEAFATKELRLTKRMVDEIVDRKIVEKNKADQKFKLNAH